MIRLIRAARLLVIYVMYFGYFITCVEGESFEVELESEVEEEIESWRSEDEENMTICSFQSSYKSFSSIFLCAALRNKIIIIRVLKIKSFLYRK